MTNVVGKIMSPRGLSKEWKILDFGCGVGRHTREFREAGYDAVGVDRPYPGLADELAALPDGGENVHLSSEVGRLPFEDDTFDLCFSTSVFEHVMDYDAALSEISRVLKPGAWTLHMFPSRWRPIESHIYVPFGARFQSYAWYRLWAQTGIRNVYQKDLGPKETARRNADYARTGLAYPTKREIARTFGRHFHRVEFVEREFVHATAEVSRISRTAVKVIDRPGMETLYRGFHNRVVLARKG